MDVVEFVYARIRDDEKLARAASPDIWETREEIDGVYAGLSTVVWGSGARVVTVGQTRLHHRRDGVAEANIAHIAYWDPRRVFAECKSKRLALAIAEHQGVLEIIAKCLAIPYSSHPDYDLDW